MGWQTTDHLLVNRGFKSHMGYLGGSESYKWGRHDSSDSPNPLTGAHDMYATPRSHATLTARFASSATMRAWLTVDPRGLWWCTGGTTTIQEWISRR
jgi:hypothetical protein